MALRTPKVSLLCVGSEDPCGGVGSKTTRQRRHGSMKPLVFIIPAQLLHNGLSVCVLPYAARREPMENRLA